MARTATLTRNYCLNPDGTFGTWLSDSGFTCRIVEKLYFGDQPDISCVDPGSGQMLWLWSEKHGCYLYHYQGDPKRTVIELHSANLASQLKGCMAPGHDIATFEPDSISPGVPSVNCRGVTASIETLGKLEADMRDPKTGEQLPFMLTISDETGVPAG